MLVFGFLDIYFSTANENVLTQGLTYVRRRWRHLTSQSRHLCHCVSSTRQMWLSNPLSCLLAFVYFFLELLAAFSRLKYLFYCHRRHRSACFFLSLFLMARRDGAVLIFKKRRLTGASEDPDNVFCKEFFNLSSHSLTDLVESSRGK